MKQILTIAFFFYQVFVFGQNVSFNNERIDTISIESNISAYQFDDNGTTKGKAEILTITYSNEKNSFIVSNYVQESYERTIEPENLNLKTKTIEKEIGRQIQDSILNILLTALTTYEIPKHTNYDLTRDLFESFVNEKTIRKVAKSYNLDWHFKMRYSTKEQNQEFFKGCQSLDTLKIYLGERFDTIGGYVFVTDYSNTIRIKIKTNNSEYNFEGKYLNPVKQPWYNHSDTSVFLAKSVLNLNINRALEEILPKHFLNRKSITMEALMNDYITWYFERSKMKY